MRFLSNLFDLKKNWFKSPTENNNYEFGTKILRMCIRVSEKILSYENSF